jgi:tRNA(fMet)-specific endonuclease VapC
MAAWSTQMCSPICSDLIRAEQFRPYLVGQPLIVCFMTVAELDRWALERSWGRERQERMAAFLAQFTNALASRSLCRTWALVVDQARRAGRPIQVADAWIVATAIELGVPLLTNNHGDYARVRDLILLPERGG